MVQRLAVQKFAHRRAAFDQAEVPLHPAIGQRRTAGQLLAHLDRLLQGGARIDGLRHQPHLGRFLARDDRRQHPEFAGPRRAEDLGRQVGPAVVTRQADLGKGGSDLGLRRADPEIAGQRQAQTGTGRRALDRRDGGFLHLVQVAHRFHPAAQVGGLLFDGHRARFARRHALDVAADAEIAVGPGQDDAAHLGILAVFGHHVGQALRHLGRHGVLGLGPVHGDDPQAAAGLGLQVGIVLHLALLLALVQSGR